MTKINTEKIVRDLIDTFLKAGEVSIKLRKNGLIKENSSLRKQVEALTAKPNGEDQK